MDQTTLNRVYYSLTDKSEYSQTAIEELLKTNGWKMEDAVAKLSLVVCTKVVVYGTLRYRDSAYERFKHCFVSPKPISVVLENYHKVHYAGRYFAVEPCDGAIVEAEMFYVYPDCMFELDQYECTAAGLYKRVWTDVGYVYVKGHCD